MPFWGACGCMHVFFPERKKDKSLTFLLWQHPCTLSHQTWTEGGREGGRAEDEGRAQCG
jgi:hypothetical protein